MIEKEALAKLRAGQHIEIHFETDRIQMLGAIRAVKDCLACHHGQRGDLLGAFSYIQQRQKAP